MRIAVVSGGPVDPRVSASQGRVCALVHTLLDQGHEVLHGHFEPTGYDRAPFLRALAAVYPALRLGGAVGQRPHGALAGCAVAVLTNLWLEPELEAAQALAEQLAAGPPVVFDSMDYLASTYVGAWPDDRVRRVASLEAEVRSRTRLSVFVSRCEALKALRLSPGLRDPDTFVLSNCHHPVAEARPFGDRRHVCLVGSAAPHNVGAAAFFLRRVWPRLARLLPDAEFHLLGAVAEVLEVGGPAELIGRVRAIGPVADLNAALDGYRVSVVPTLTGSGIKGKALDSMARGTPVVTTIAGAEGMPLVHNRNAVLAAADESFADAVAALYQDRPRWEQLSAEGLGLVTRRFSPVPFRRRVRRLVRRMRQLG